MIYVCYIYQLHSCNPHINPTRPFLKILNTYEDIPNMAQLFSRFPVGEELVRVNMVIAVLTGVLVGVNIFVTTNIASGADFKVLTDVNVNFLTTTTPP